MVLWLSPQGLHRQLKGDEPPRGKTLRPLRRFGLLEYRDGPALFVPDMWRKSALLGRFLQRATGIVRIEGALA